MKALPIVEKGACCCVWSCVLLRLVLCVVALCVALLHLVLVKEVMGWWYFADMASMIFSEKKHIAACDMFFWGYGVKK
jgi:hypothetical protein